MERQQVIIMGAAGHDFHNFNTYFRSNPSHEVVTFTATPIDLGRLLKMNKPSQRVRYELQVIGQPTLEELLEKRFGRKQL
jgi:predicted GTPase